MKLSRFFLDLLEYKATFMLIFILFVKIIVAFPKPYIRFAGPYIMFTLALIKIKFKKYFLSRRIVCVIPLSTKHMFPISFLKLDCSFMFRKEKSNLELQILNNFKGLEL